MVDGVNRLMVESTMALDQSGPVLCPSETVIESTLGSPLAVVAVRRTRSVPDASVTGTDAVAQVSQLAVGPNVGVATTVPLTLRLAGRLVVVPLAYRMPRVKLPDAAAVTANSMYAPISLLLLTKPVPVKPAWLDSTTPWKMAPGPPR